VVAADGEVEQQIGDTGTGAPGRLDALEQHLDSDG